MRQCRPLAFAAHLLVIALAAGTSDDRCFGQTGAQGKQPPENAVKKLGGASRALAEPETITTLPASNKRPVLIYYANESAPDAGEGRNLATLVEWIKSARQPVVRRLGWQMEYQNVLMPFVVDFEIGALGESGGAGTDAGFDLVVFTNRLTREGRFLVKEGGAQAFVGEQWAPPKFSRPVAASFPLSQEVAFDAALTAAAKRFDPARHEFVLITKSHGSPQHALTTSTCVQTSQVGREEILNSLAATAQRRSEAFAKIAKPLKVESRPLPIDGDGNRLLVSRGLAYWEGHGFVYLRKHRDIHLVDTLGTPYRTADGRRLIVEKGFLVLEKSGESICHDDGAPVVVAAVAGVDRRLIPWNWKEPNELPSGRQALARTDLMKHLERARKSDSTGADPDEIAALSKTSAAALYQVLSQRVDGAEFDWAELVLADARFGQVATATIDPTKVSASQRSSIPVIVLGAEPIPQTPALKKRHGKPTEEALLRELADWTGLLLDPTKMGNDPILDPTKMGNYPILDSTKMGNDPILDPSKLGDDPILDCFEIKFTRDPNAKVAAVPAKVEEQSPIKKGTETKHVGTTKDQYFAVLKRHADAGMTLRLVFVESCRSSLTPVQLGLLRTSGTPIERIWTSDSHGLDFQTLDYDALIRRTRTEGLIPALDAELRRRYTEQHGG